jgi:hypothetical protein
VGNGRLLVGKAIMAALMLQLAAGAGLDAAGSPEATSIAEAGTTWMALEMPAQGAILPSSFAATGWALDPAASSGPGVDAIQLYAYRNFGSGESPIFLGNASYGVPRQDVASSYGQAFTPCGFTLNVSGLPAGSYRLFAFAHNVATAAYSAYVFADVTVAPYSGVAIDAPAESAPSTSAFEVAGWALDNQAASGSGIDAVHIYASPNGGNAAAVFLGVASLGWTRNDVAAAFGAQFAQAGYHFTVTGLGPGDYVLYVFGHSTVTNAFTVMASRVVRVVATTLLSIDTPSPESTIAARAFSVSGWAFDRSSTDGSGVDTLHVYALPDPGSGRAPIFLGAATVGVGRPDVSQAFGSQFATSGYALQVNADAAGLSPGVYDVVVWAHSRVTNTFTAAALVRVILR